MNIFDGLNNQQIEAVKVTEGPVLILAGAGSGKTKTLTHRIAYLLSQGVKPENILALTFTNKAAEEMKNRVASLIYGSRFMIYGLFIGTFHSFGVKILRNESERLGYKNNFVIYDEDDVFSLAKDIAAGLNFLKDKFKPATALHIISKAKNELRGAGEFAAESGGFYKDKILKFYNIYERQLKKANALDFDDLIALPVKIFEKYPDALLKYRNQYKYILIDEYQDTNHAQYQLINLLAKKHKNLFVIGDPDQAIYGWRYADFRNILNFEYDYPGARVIKLEQNYRSTQNILDAAHEIISKNIERKEKKLWTQNQTGDLIEVVENANEREEADFIVNRAADLSKNQSVNLDKIVVMYRTNAQSRALEEACLYANLPYRVIGGIKFFQRREIKDILAFLRLIQNSNDEISQKRIMGILGKRKFDDFTGSWDKIKEEAKTFSIANLIKSIIKKTGYYNYIAAKFPGTASDGEPESESRINNIKELIGLASKYNKIEPVSALSDFLAEAALMQDQPEAGPPRAGGRRNESGGKLNLMTLHSAKGLEFDAVFIAGAEEKLLPHARSAYSFDELEEERRLCYVGLTRAKKHLCLSFVKHRNLWGESGEVLPSRFIMELPPHLVRFQSLADGYNLPEIEL